MIDRVAQARDLLIQQYKETLKLTSLVDAFTSKMNELEVVNDDLLNDRGIDTAQGFNLDVIGKIVVLDRPYTDPDPEEIFTYDNPEEIGGGFTDEGNTEIGGYFIGLSPVQNQKFSDSQYRFTLRAKIIYNTSNATIEDMHTYGSFVFDREVSIVNRVGAVDLTVSRPIGRQERIILDQTFPLPAGVRLGYLATAPSNGAFGFAGDDRNGGFGDFNDPAVGGRFASLVID